MNTPKPCDTCKHLYVNVLHEDDPTYGAECWLKLDGIACVNGSHYEPQKADEATRTVSVARLVEIKQLLDTMCAREDADTATLVRDWLDEVIGGEDDG
jgi:hypothetical protein